MTNDDFLHTRWAKAQDARRDELAAANARIKELEEWRKVTLEAVVENRRTAETRANMPLLARLEEMEREVCKPTEGDTVLDHAIAWQEKSKDAAALRRVIALITRPDFPNKTTTT